MAETPQGEFQLEGGHLMSDEGKPREQLIQELHVLRQRVIELENALERQTKITPLSRSSDPSHGETQFGAILNSAIASIARFRVAADGNWEPEFYSAGSEAIYGYSTQELLDNPNLWSSRVLPEDMETVILPVFERVFCEDAVTVEYRFRHRSGALRWISSTYTSTWDEASTCQYVTVVNIDITNLKQVEEALRTSETRFTRAFRASPDAISIVTFNEGRVIDVNDNFLSLFGYTRDEVIGRTTAEIGIWASSQDRSRVIQVLEAGSEVYNLEVDCCTKSGEIKTLLASSERLNLDGQDCVLTIAKDITERKRAESILQEAIAGEQQAIQRERFIATIAQTIRQSLNLQQVLNTTVAEVRQFLQVDRVLVIRFHADYSVQIMAESIRDPAFSLQNRVIYDPCFGDTMIHHYRQGRIHRINDVLSATIDPCYANLLTSLDVRAVLIIPILVKQDLWGLLVAHQCTSPCHWEELNWLMLQQLSTQLAIGIHQAELYQQVQQQAQREQALNQVIQDIRNSLDLNTVFATATSEVVRLLQIDRAEIVQYLPDQKLWLNVASYRRTPDLPNAIGLRIPDDENEFAARLKQREVVRVNDYSTRADKANQPFVQEYPGAWLLVPLEVGESVWGSLSLNYTYPWHWQDWEVELACAVANQLAIAIQQSQLYIEIQELNEDLEQQVQVRTAQLHQALEFEALLKRITDKVRDSLDEAQILQTAVEELTQGLRLVGCDTALYDLNQRISTICFEHIQAELPPAKGRQLKMAALPDLYSQLLQGQPTQFCHCRTTTDIARRPRQDFAILACPMIDKGEVIGDVWLFKPYDADFNSLEVRLMQQVANQCAIALRQSRLYQASQAQVEELERLNRLKDDFLSTVSHELRTPMASIKMATQMLELLLFQPQRATRERESASSLPHPSLQRAQQYFQILQDECDREIRLINDLLDLSRLDAGTEPLILATIDPKIWIAHIAEPFIALAQNQQQQLELNLPATLPELTTDLSDLERIFTELLSNACKYSPAGERILVSARIAEPASQKTQAKGESFSSSASPSSNPPRFLLAVTNTGVEIPASERDLIFEKFYRMPNSDPWKHGGTGLGLALVKKLVHRLKGNVHVESSEGQVTFTVQLPLQPSPDETNRVDEPAPSSPNGSA